MTPEGKIYGQNSKFWQFWGLYSHISAAINVKFGTVRSPVPNFTFIGAIDWVNWVDYWVKTIPAWLRRPAGNNVQWLYVTTMFSMTQSSIPRLVCDTWASCQINIFLLTVTSLRLPVNFCTKIINNILFRGYFWPDVICQVRCWNSLAR